MKIMRFWAADYVAAEPAVMIAMACGLVPVLAEGKASASDFFAESVDNTDKSAVSVIIN